jgi:hypothetical protein
VKSRIVLTSPLIDHPPQHEPTVERRGKVGGKDETHLPVEGEKMGKERKRIGVTINKQSEQGEGKREAFYSMNHVPLFAVRLQLIILKYTSHRLAKTAGRREETGRRKVDTTEKPL